MSAPNGTARIAIRPTYLDRSDKWQEHEHPARITAKRVTVRLDVFDRTSGQWITRHRLFCYPRHLVAYRLDGASEWTVIP